MAPSRTRVLLVLLASSILPGPVQLAAQPDKELQAQIDDAVTKAILNLVQAQHRDGSWSPHNVQFPTGQTALVVYALLKAGVPKDHPAVQQGTAFITAREPNEVYSAACQLLALEALGEPRDRIHKDHMSRILKALLAAQRKTWPYRYGRGQKPGHRDLSLTQFAVMGLWAATRAGLKVPAKAWKEAIEGALLLQREPAETVAGDGVPVAGFRYRNEKVRVATGSMTAAGISVLTIARHNLKKQMPKLLSRKVERSLRFASAWLTQNFAVKQNPKGKGRKLYYLYGLERAASLLGVQKFGDHDWYQEGARHLVTVRRWTNDETGACFAILFLVRATGTDLGLPGAGSARDAVIKLAGDKKWSTPGWMITAAHAGTRNLLLQDDPKKGGAAAVEASSKNNERHAAENAIDGFENTAWRWHQKDKEPWIELTLRKPTNARILVLTNAASRRRDLGRQAHATSVSVSVNGGPVSYHPIEKDELRPTRIDLPGRRKIKKLKIVVLARKRRDIGSKAKPLQVGGFAEISLER